MLIDCTRIKHSATIAALIGAMVLTLGCGRAGAPLKPSESAIKQAKANKEPAPDKPVPNSKNPGKSFILDGLLD